MENRNYKWSWGVDQRAIIESGLKIDIIDFSILRMLMDFSSSDACQKMHESGTIFYMFRWKLIKDQLPILNLNTRQSVKRRIDKLVDAKIIAPHPNNQQSRSSWFRFAENRDLLFKNKCKQKLPSVNKELQTVTNNYQYSQQPFTHTDNNGLHYNTINNNTTNILIPPKVGKIETKIPEDWKIEIKQIVIQFLEYRQALPTKDRIKTQQGWNGKINLFTKILKEHSEDILIKAINLSIEKEYKNVKVEWLFNEYPELRAKKVNGDSSLLSDQQAAKQRILEIYKEHPEKWGGKFSKYGMRAQTNYCEALKIFYRDFPQLKPQTNAT